MLLVNFDYNSVQIEVIGPELLYLPAAMRNTRQRKLMANAAMRRVFRLSTGPKTDVVVRVVTTVVVVVVVGFSMALVFMTVDSAAA